MSYVKSMSVGGKKSQTSDVGTSNLGTNGKTSTDSGTNGHTGDAPKLPPKPVREQVRVIFSYNAQNDDELTIKEGDIITVISKDNEDVGWWKGELNGRIALFPDNFIEPYQIQAPPPTGVRNITTEMNNSQTPSTVDKQSALKKPERPSSLAKPSLGSSNNENEPSPVVTPTSPSAPTNIAPNSVASKKLKFSQLSQFQQNTQPKPPVSLSNSADKQNNNHKEHDDAKKAPKAPVSIDSNSNDSGRLVHLTALRPKIPTTARRPPSMTLRSLSLIDEPSSPLDVPDSSIESTKESTENGTIPAAPVEKKQAPWMNEMMVSVHKRRINIKPTPSVTTTTTTTNGPTAITAQNSTTSSSTVSAPSTENAVETKPIALNKPTVPPSSTKPISQTTSTEDDSVPAKHHTTTKPIANVTLHDNVLPTISSKDLESINELKEENLKLKNEIKIMKSKIDKLELDYDDLKSSLMSQDDLLKQKSSLERLIQEQKESFEAQRKALFEMGKELIDKNSEDKKKIANLEIEIERIHKLNSII